MREGGTSASTQGILARQTNRAGGLDSTDNRWASWRGTGGGVNSCWDASLPKRINLDSP